MPELLCGNVGPPDSGGDSWSCEDAGLAAETGDLIIMDIVTRIAAN